MKQLIFYSAPKFHLPEDQQAPIIMVGAGCGIAPFRSFWTDREAALNREDNETAFGPMYVFFGCRQSDADNIYEKETTSLLKKGVISQVFTAFSREPGQKKVGKSSS